MIVPRATDRPFTHTSYSLPDVRPVRVTHFPSASSGSAPDARASTPPSSDRHPASVRSRAQTSRQWPGGSRPSESHVDCSADLRSRKLANGTQLTPRTRTTNAASAAGPPSRPWRNCPAAGIGPSAAYTPFSTAYRTPSWVPWNSGHAFGSSNVS